MNKVAYALLGAVLLLPVRAGASDAPSLPSAADLAADPVLLEPALAPDGREIAAIVDDHGLRRLAILDAAKPDFPTRLVPLPADEQVDWFRWASGGRLVVAATSPKTSRLLVLDSATLAAVPLASDPAGFAEGDLLHMDAHGRSLLLRVHAPHKGEAAIDRISLADGSRTHLVAPQHGVGNWVVDGNGVVRAGVADHGDQRVVIYRTGEDERFRHPLQRADRNLDVQQLLSVPGSDLGYAVAPSDGRLALYRYDFRRQALGSLVYANPRVDIDGYTLERDGTLSGVSYTADHVETHWFDPRIKAIQTAVDARLPGTANELMTVSDDRQRALVWSSAPSEPGRFYLYDWSSGSLRFIVAPYPKLVGKTIAPMRPIRYRARDGLEISGYLTLPVGRPAKSLPLVVMPHGGPFARDSEDFDPWVAYLAAQGYAVLQPNFRGSTGFGDAFTEKGDGQWGRGMQDDIDDAVDWAAAQGIADAKRVCIMGASFGGYAAMWAAHEPARYRCAISFAGISDVAAQLRSDRPTFPSGRAAREWRTRIQGDKHVTLASLSPITYADRTIVPLLIAHGEADDNVPVEQSRMLDRALTHYGRPHELVTYPGEGHGLSEPKDNEDFLNRVGKFLAKYNPS